MENFICDEVAELTLEINKLKNLYEIFINSNFTRQEPRTKNEIALWAYKYTSIDLLVHTIFDHIYEIKTRANKLENLIIIKENKTK